MRKSVLLSLAAMSAGLLFAGAASAAGPNLVTNGSFETNGGNGQVNFNTSIAGWSAPALNGSYVFVYAPGTADTIGSDGEYGNVSIYGPGNGNANGLPATSPDGGYFIASDPAFQNGALSQNVTGLTAGHKYTVSFDWAGAQQVNFGGATTEGWQVSLGGGAAQNTATLDNADHGFTGWQTANLTFTADGTSDVLSFLATGGPNSGFPPFALLDGVSVTGVPEPATWAVMLVGFGGLGAAIRTRRKQIAATA